MLDEMLTRKEGMIVVNYEIWRRDTDVLAKLMKWQADSIIVDEAHALKNTSSANFKSIKSLVFVDNTCPACDSQINGVYEPQVHALAPRVSRPCWNCGWTIGTHVRDYANPSKNTSQQSQSRTHYSPRELPFSIAQRTSMPYSTYVTPFSSKPLPSSLPRTAVKTTYLVSGSSVPELYKTLSPLLKDDSLHGHTMMLAWSSPTNTYTLYLWTWTSKSIRFSTELLPSSVKLLRSSWTVANA